MAWRTGIWLAAPLAVLLGGRQPARANTPTAEPYDRVGPRAIDARVIKVILSEDQLELWLAPPHADRDRVTNKWTGVFVGSDDKPIEGTDFKLAYAFKGQIRAVILTGRLPSHHVRLYEPDHPRAR